MVLFSITTYTSGFSIENKKPNSLVFVENSDTNTSYWATYNNTLDSYTEQIFNDNFTEESIPEPSRKSKYNTLFKYHKTAVYKNIPTSRFSILSDTVIDNKREINFSLIPLRKVNKYELYTPSEMEIGGMCVNGESFDFTTSMHIKKGTVLTYQMAHFDAELSVLLKLPKNSKPALILNEVSYDLLTNPLFSLQPRNEAMMPMPFVTNDAVITSKKLKF